MSIVDQIEQLEQEIGVKLPEPYRTTLINNQGQSWTIDKWEPNEIVLWGIDRVEYTYSSFQRGFGEQATAGILPIGGWFGGGSHFAVNQEGAVVDLFGNPPWQIIAPSLEEFLARIRREGVEWVNEFYRGA